VLIEKLKAFFILTGMVFIAVYFGGICVASV
jgi:hypothetical protein